MNTAVISLLNTINVEFPGLGIEGDTGIGINDILFSIGNVNVTIHGLIIGLGIILCGVISFLFNKKNGRKADSFADDIISAAVGSILFARIFYVLFNPGQFSGNFGGIFKLWDGGLSLEGSIIGGFLGLLFISKVKKERFFETGDIFAPGVLAGISLGIWGELISQINYGNYTDLPWAMTSEVVKNDDLIKKALSSKGVMGIPMVHPVFLYRSLLLLIGFGLIMLFIWKFKKNAGETFTLAAAWYGLTGFITQFFIAHKVLLGSIDILLIIYLIIFALGIALFIDIRRKTEKASVEKKTEPVRSSFAGVVAKVDKLTKEAEEEERRSEGSEDK